MRSEHTRDMTRKSPNQIYGSRVQESEAMEQARQEECALMRN